MKIVLLLHTNHISFIQDHFTCCHADGMMETKTWQPNTTLSQLWMIIIISPHYPPHSLHRYQRLARGGGSRRCRLTGGLVPHPFGFHLQRLILSEHCCFWSQHVLTFFSPPDHIISYNIMRRRTLTDHCMLTIHTGTIDVSLTAVPVTAFWAITSRAITSWSTMFPFRRQSLQCPCAVNVLINIPSEKYIWNHYRSLHAYLGDEDRFPLLNLSIFKRLIDGFRTYSIFEAQVWAFTPRVTPKLLWWGA